MGLGRCVFLISKKLIFLVRRLIMGNGIWSNENSSSGGEMKKRKKKGKKKRT